MAELSEYNIFIVKKELVSGEKDIDSYNPDMLRDIVLRVRLWTHIYEFADDPFEAVAAYAELLTDTYGFELTDTYVEEGLGAWHLSDGAAAVRVYCDMSGSGFEVYIDIDNTLNCVYAETWDWNAAPSAGQDDISVLPDFLAIDSSGKY